LGNETPHRTMIRAISIVVVSTILGVLVDWRAPGIDRYLWDCLRSARGAMPPPDDVAIVALDEPSIARLGAFPWPRTVAARAIDAIAAAQPKVIALDVLYIDPTTAAADGELARSIARAGNVVVAAQLTDPPAARAWLLPLPEIERAAASLGHVNVLQDEQGIERELEMRPTDDSGRAIYPMAVEVARFGENAKRRPTDALLITIDYIGPAGSFASRTYSFVDVIEGRVPAADFRGKYVLIGATAASLGGRIGSMPGVEVLANAVNAILRSRYYSETGNVNELLYAALAAAVTLATGRLRVIPKIAALAAIAVGIVIIGYIAYTRFLVYPPLTAELVALACAAVIGLLWRSRRSPDHL
jgi:adenylate cyclase